MGLAPAYEVEDPRVERSHDAACDFLGQSDAPKREDLGQLAPEVLSGFAGEGDYCDSFFGNAQVLMQHQ